MLEKHTGQNHCCNEEVQKVNFRGKDECIGQFSYSSELAGCVCWGTKVGHILRVPQTSTQSCAQLRSDGELPVPPRGHPPSPLLQAGDGGKEMLGWFSCIVGPFYFNIYLQNYKQVKGERHVKVVQLHVFHNLETALICRCT